MEWLEVTLPGGRSVFAPGEEIEASAVWQLDEVPKSLELRLFWYTEGKGDRDTEIVLFESLEPRGSGHRTCRFRVPELAPASFSGRLVSLLWAIELVVGPGQRAARAELVVSPTGYELPLYGPGGETDASA